VAGKFFVGIGVGLDERPFSKLRVYYRPPLDARCFWHLSVFFRFRICRSDLRIG